MKSNTTCILAASAALALTAGTAQADTVLFSDDFSGLAADDLNGTTPDITQAGATWNADTTFKADGSLAINNNNEGAYLSYDFVNGTIYELEATIFNNSTSGWLAVGFSDHSTNLGLSDRRHSNANNGGGYGWVLSRDNTAGGDQQFFAGKGTSNPIAAAGGDVADPTQDIDVKIVLDTTGGDDAWTVSYFLNGVAVPNGTNILLPATADNDISGFGFSRDGFAADTTPAQITSVTLTEVPEPGSLALLGLGGLLMARRRRA